MLRPRYLDALLPQRARAAAAARAGGGSSALLLDAFEDAPDTRESMEEGVTYMPRTPSSRQITFRTWDHFPLYFPGRTEHV
jgi:hypothetical protein